MGLVKATVFDFMLQDFSVPWASNHLVAFLAFQFFAYPVPGFFVYKSPAPSFGKFFLDKSTIVTLRHEANELSPGWFFLRLPDLDAIAEVQQLRSRKRVKQSRVERIIVYGIAILLLLLIRWAWDRSLNLSSRSSWVSDDLTPVSNLSLRLMFWVFLVFGLQYMNLLLVLPIRLGRRYDCLQNLIPQISRLISRAILAFELPSNLYYFFFFFNLHRLSFWMFNCSWLSLLLGSILFFIQARFSLFIKKFIQILWTELGPLPVRRLRIYVDWVLKKSF